MDDFSRWDGPFYRIEELDECKRCSVSTLRALARGP
jgi:hypothetical protein